MSVVFQNYHRHSNYSIITHGGDSVVKNEEYAQRAVELGHSILSGVEHGFQGRHVEGYDLSKKYNLKFLFGSEAYFVKDRFAKDRSNNHIVLLAKNENGRKALNVALSEAFTSGYYYVPRLDLDLLLSLPSKDIWITSACLGGWKYEDSDYVWLTLAEHFGDNFFFEVQAHNTDSQKQLNSHILNISRETGIKTIFGCDSHYIFSHQAKDRENYLVSKGIVYEDEAGWYMDYPDGDEVVKRFKEQGVLSEEEIMESIDNTNVFLEVEEYNSPVYTKEIKMPTLHPEKTKEEKDAIYENLIWDKWSEEKKKINPELWEKYESEIKKEVDVVKEIGHADYFLLDYEIVKRGKEKGGVITSTGRGSGVSYYTCKLLDLTKIDRISSPVKLYPERFLSKTRILETKSLADLDLNLANPEVFAEAQREILGDEHSYPMIAWGTMRAKEAWKMYSRANHIDFDTANDVSGQIEEYEFALKHAEEDDDISIDDYVDAKYLKLVKESSKYLGIYSNVKQHPCFVAGSKVLTMRGYLNIEDVKSGDAVFTHRGNWKKVLHIDKKMSSDGIFSVRSGLNWFKATGNHPLLVKNIKSTKKGRIESHEYWEDIEEIYKNKGYKNNYKIASPINKESIIPFFEGVDLNNEDFWWIIGRYLGDEYIYSPRKHDYRIFISCNRNEVDDISEKLKNLYKFRIDDSGKTAVKITFNNRKLFNFLSIFGKYAEGKHIPMEIINSPKNLLKSLLEGYLSADGHFYDNGNIGFSTVSISLALGIQSVVHKTLGRNCTISKTRDYRIEKIEERVVNCLPQYAGRISAGNNSKQWCDSDYAWYNIDEIRYEESNQEVYNFEVEDDNSYTVNNLAVHNCGYLIAPFNIKEEAGLIAMKTAKGTINVCTLIDGLWAEKNKMLKNDLLKVNVVELYSRVYKRIGMDDTHDVNELWEIAKKDDSIWDIYRKGAVIGINQVEQTGTAKRVMKYAPKNISELSAFVAAVRPGFASMYDIFESRQHFDYGIEAFDKLVQTEELPHSFVLYQEQAMAAMNFAGIPMDRTYEIVKSIAKKRYDDVFSAKEQFINGFYEVTGSMETSQKIWQILEDSSRYSFNSSHSLSVATDSLYTAYLKAHYPLFFYEQLLQILEEKGEKDRLLRAKAEAQRHFKISFPAMKFGQDNTKILANEKTNEITMSMSTLKGFGNSVSESLLELSKKFEGKDIIDLFVFAIENGFFSASKWEKLIMIGYFSEFGGGKKVINFFNEFTKGKSKYGAKLKDSTKDKRIQELRDIWNNLDDVDFSTGEKIRNEVSVIGEVRSKFPVDKRYFFVLEVSDEQSGNPYSPRVLLHSLKSGYADMLKISKKIYQPVKAGDIIFCHNFEKKPAVKKVDGEWINIPETFNWWMTDYEKLSEARVITMSEEQ